MSFIREFYQGVLSGSVHAFTAGGGNDFKVQDRRQSIIASVNPKVILEKNGPMVDGY
jgi:hypothetical protein